MRRPLTGTGAAARPAENPSARDPLRVDGPSTAEAPGQPLPDRATLPAAMLVFKAGPLDGQDLRLVEQARAVLGDVPLSVHDIGDTMVSQVHRMASALSLRATPCTQVLILTDPVGHDHAHRLQRQIGVLTVQLFDGQRPSPLLPLACPEVIVSEWAPPDLVAGLARTAAAHWAGGLRWRDEDYVDQLADWVRAPGRSEGDSLALIASVQRQLVASRPHALDPMPLILAGTGLRRLPPLPPRCITALDLGEHCIEDLLELPSTLVHLRANSERLQTLRISAARLTALRVIDLQGNQLRSVPPDLLRFGPEVQVFLSGNPIDWPTRQRIEQRQVPFDAGPRLHLDSVSTESEDSSAADDSTTGASTSESEAHDPVIDALAAAVGQSHADALDPVWDTIDTRAGASAFSRFLRRFAQFPARVRDAELPALIALVDAMARDNALADTVLAVVNDASESCSDRVALTWCRMQLAVRCHQLSLGEHDDDLPRAVAMAREVFRHERLADIAQAKVGEIRQTLRNRGASPEALEHVEEIEIHLAFVSELHGLLGLGGEPPRARFAHQEVSGVSVSDLHQALRRVRQQESRDFANFLANWTPWQALLRRLDPDAFDAIDEAMADPAFFVGIEAELRARLSSGDWPEDARGDALTRAVQVRGQELRTEQLLALTRRVLEQRGQRHLLEPSGDRG